MSDIDETHDISRRSWIESANDASSDFPIQNLPFGVFDDGRGARGGIAIGDRILDLRAAVEAALLDGEAGRAAAACLAPALNALMAMGAAPRIALRRAASRLLATDTIEGRRAAAVAERITVPMSEATPLLPASIGDYTDFYASVHHATNVGSMFRPDNALLPNYKWVPIGYHGRSSSIVASGTAVRRPVGQTKADGTESPTVAPSARLDYECEVGAFVGAGNPLGERFSLDAAESHLVGLCLVNDWSARDIQAWEYQPLGPFLAKNFATTVSPWIVTLEALAPFRSPRAARSPGDPAPLAYLDAPTDRERGGFDIELSVTLSSSRMRSANVPPMPLSRAFFRDMYWTLAQMLTHHASNGCNLRPGDLIASGTVSGPEKGSRGCLLELTWRGTEPLTLPTGETRRFLEDGDEVRMRGRCTRTGFAAIGFGDCVGTVLPATTLAPAP